MTQIEETKNNTSGLICPPPKPMGPWGYILTGATLAAIIAWEIWQDKRTK